MCFKPLGIASMYMCVCVGVHAWCVLNLWELLLCVCVYVCRSACMVCFKLLGIASMCVCVCVCV